MELIRERTVSSLHIQSQLVGEKSHSDFKVSNLNARCVNTLIMERYIDINS